MRLLGIRNPCLKAFSFISGIQRWPRVDAPFVATVPIVAIFTITFLLLLFFQIFSSWYLDNIHKNL